MVSRLLDRALAVQSLGRWSPYAGRGVRERIQLDPVDTHLALELIDDSYNANPTSMAAALEVLAASEVTHDIGRVSKGRRIAFVGDMKELGPEALALHAGLADLEATRALDVVHCVGPLMKAFYDNLPEHQRGDWTETAEEMFFTSLLEGHDPDYLGGTTFQRLDELQDKPQEGSRIAFVRPDGTV